MIHALPRRPVLVTGRPGLVPHHMLGRVFGNLYGAVGMAAAISYVGGELLLDATSAPLTSSSRERRARRRRHVTLTLPRALGH